MVPDLSDLLGVDVVFLEVQGIGGHLFVMFLVEHLNVFNQDQLGDLES